MRRKFFMMALIASFLCICRDGSATDFVPQAGALGQSPPVPGAQPSAPVAIPFFDRIMTLVPPSGFQVAHQQKGEENFSVEWVPSGETKTQWTQLLTATGVRGSNPNPAVTAQMIAERIAGRFQQACPQTFDAKGIGAFQLGRYSGYVALSGCGKQQNLSPEAGEISLLVVMRGVEGFYTIHWAERVPSSDTRPTFDEALWRSRLNALQPIRVCQRLENDPDPYVSCLRGIH